MERHLIITNELGESVDLYTDEGIRIVSIDGIGFEANIKSMEVHGYDGALYQDEQLKPRNIPIIVRYRGPAWKHEQHKNRLSRLIANKQMLTIRKVTDNIDVYIKGYAERVNTPPNVHPMTTQISITCTDPYWKASGDNSHVISGTESCFEFPIEIDEDEGMEFGRIESALIVPIYNEGTADSGAVFTFTAITACSNPRIENVDTGEFMEVAVDMAIGDVLVVDTRYDSKSISFTHEGVTEDYFNKRSARSDFFQIKSGYNYLKYTVGTGDEHALDITVKFDERYGGI